MGNHYSGRKKMVQYDALAIIKNTALATQDYTTPDPPDWVQSDDLALEEWNRVVTAMEGKRILSTLDQTTLAMHCQMFSLWRRALDRLTIEGFTVPSGEKGGVKTNPLTNVVKNYYAVIVAGLKLFGMTPSARSSLRIMPDPETINPPSDGFDEFCKTNGEVIENAIPQKFDY